MKLVTAGLFVFGVVRGLPGAAADLQVQTPPSPVIDHVERPSED